MRRSEPRHCPRLLWHGFTTPPRQTIRKWQDRTSTVDGAHASITVYTTLTPAQELIVVELRKTLLLPTDDLLAVTREFINPAVSRAGLGRCLRRHGVSNLVDLIIVPEGDTPATKKTFKDYGKRSINPRLVAQF